MKARKWEALSKAEQHLKIVRAMADVRYFLNDPYFVADPPLKAQQEILHRFYSSPGIYELILIGGRRGGKTTLGSYFSRYEAFKLIARGDPAKYYGLSPGQEIEIVNLAKSAHQSKKTIFGKTKTQILLSPFFMAHLNPKKDVRAEEIYFPDHNIVIESLSSSGASGRGRTVKLLMFDELAFFEETEGDQGAWSVYNAMVPSTSTFKEEGYRIAIGSCNHEKDILMELYRRAHATDENGNRLFPSMMGLIMPTWELNPENYPRDCKFLKEEELKDPVAFAREYACVPYQSEMQFFAMPEKIDACMDPSRENLLEILNEVPGSIKPSRGRLYCLGMDPAARVDNFGLALSYLAPGNVTVHAGLLKLSPEYGQTEIDPDNLWEFIYNVWKHFRFYYAVIDVPMFPTLRKRLQQLGVKIYQNIVKKEHYDRYKEAIYSGKVRAPFYPLWANELKELVLLRGNKVDHPRRGSKDVADAACNTHYLLHEVVPKPCYMPVITNATSSSSPTNLMSLQEYVCDML